MQVSSLLLRLGHCISDCDRQDLLSSGTDILHECPHLGDEGSDTPTLLDGLACELTVPVKAITWTFWSTAAPGSAVHSTLGPPPYLG